MGNNGSTTGPSVHTCILLRHCECRQFKNGVCTHFRDLITIRFKNGVCTHFRDCVSYWPEKMVMNLKFKVISQSLCSAVGRLLMEQEVSHSSPTNAWSQVCGWDADRQEVSRCSIRGESQEGITSMPPPSINKAAHSGFESQGRHHQNPKQGYQWPHKWTCGQQNFKKMSKTGLSVGPQQDLWHQKLL